MKVIKLRPKYKAFADEYLANGYNATAAARKVCKPGRKQSAYEQAGYRMSNNVEILAYMNAMLEDAELTAKQVLAQLSQQAMSDIGDAISTYENGEWYVDVDKAIRLRKTHLIRRMSKSRGKTDTDSIEMVDSQAALITLAKKHKLLSDAAQDVNHKIGISEEMEAILQKVFGGANGTDNAQ